MTIPILLILLWSSYNALIAQTSNEPGNNLNSSLFELRQICPKLTYHDTDDNGVDIYSDGEGTSEGIGIFFHLKYGKVIKEEMGISANNGFPYDLYKSLRDTFLKGNYTKIENENYYYVFHYSYFKIQLTYVSENGTNLALIVWSLKE